MRLFLLTALTMVAFAANSVLNRLALIDGAMGPAAFAAVRLLSGAVVLVALSAMRGSIQWGGPGRVGGVLSLAVYVLGFSFAYVSLPAGLGALILFGGVQITMFAGAVLAKEDVPITRWIGAVMAFGGLVWLLWPTGGADVSYPIGALALMAAAAVGWGIYSLLGRGARQPLQMTAVNFAWASPIALLVFAILPDGVSGYGIALAIMSGAITSGLGYALWYSVLPGLGATRAAVAQLTVPVIALAGGMVFLGEALTLRFAVSCVLVLGGIAVSLIKPRRPN